MTDITDIDQLVTRHQEPQPASKEDVVDVARLFNAVGSELTKVQKHQTDGSVNAMQLDKNKVFTHDPIPTPAYPAPPVHAQHVNTAVPATNHVVNVAPPPRLTGTAITISLNEYEKQKKSIAALKRKQTKLEKDLSNVLEMVSVINKNTKYSIETNNIECTCNNTTTLMKTIANELQSNPVYITIKKC
jgi:hypothetical protein